MKYLNYILTIIMLLIIASGSIMKLDLGFEFPITIALTKLFLYIIAFVIFVVSAFFSIYNLLTIKE